MFLPIFLMGIVEQNMYSMTFFILNEASGFLGGVGACVVYLGSGEC